MIVACRCNCCQRQSIFPALADLFSNKKDVETLNQHLAEKTAECEKFSEGSMDETLSDDYFNMMITEYEYEPSHNQEDSLYRNLCELKCSWDKQKQQLAEKALIIERGDEIKNNWENNCYQEAVHYNWLDDQLKQRDEWIVQARVFLSGLTHFDDINEWYIATKHIGNDKGSEEK